MTSRPLPASRRLTAKPWQRRTPRPYRREILLLDEPPLAQICVYDDAIILTRRDRRTHAWTSYGVSESALRAALIDDTRSSGYLPPNTVAIGHLNDAPWLLMAVPPRAIVLVNRSGGSDQRFVFITPPLLLAGWKQTYALFALGTIDYPMPDAAMYRAPFPNCAHDGRICWGSATPAPALPDTMLPALELFLDGSLFSSHLADGKSRRFPVDVCALNQTLAADQPYPLDDLVPLGRSLASLLTGTLWRA